MPTPSWLLPMLMGGQGKGDVNVQTSTSQQVAQSANISVNPIFAVQTPGAHFDPTNNLEPKTGQEQRSIPDQSWRQADPGGIPLPGAISTQYEPVSSVGDVFTDGGESMLSSVTGMPIILVIGGGLLIFVLVKMKKRR